MLQMLKRNSAALQKISDCTEAFAVYETTKFKLLHGMKLHSMKSAFFVLVKYSFLNLNFNCFLPFILLPLS